MPTALTPLIDRAQLASLRAGFKLTHHPGLQLRARELQHRDDNTDDVQMRLGLSDATLERVLAAGLDNPGYRFARDLPFFEYMSARSAELKGCSWLDVGAGTGCVDLYLADMLQPTSFDLCDVDITAKTAAPVRQIDGTRLDYPDKGYDLVFFTYVLHHAADSTIQLLRDAKRIARTNVIVLEDPKETADDYRWAYRHDRRGTFRGHREWLSLFELLGFSLVHDQPLSADIHSRHLYVLAP